MDSKYITVDKNQQIEKVLLGFCMFFHYGPLSSSACIFASHVIIMSLGQVDVIIMSLVKFEFLIRFLILKIGDCAL